MKVKTERHSTELSDFRGGLSHVDPAMLEEYFADVAHHICLPKAEKALIFRDFEAAISFYLARGVSLTEAMDRLSPENLGGFYARPESAWYPLDDAAKIYPLSMKRGQMAIFRLAANMKQAVVPELLQMALTFTIKRFPSFATTVRKGFFWHYLASSKRRYYIEPETGVPCRPINIAASGAQSFRVLYYGNRISVEYFHILTDGTGGMVFLKTLVTEYLRLLGICGQEATDALNVNGIPDAEEIANEFSRGEKTEQASGFIDKSAVQMDGALSRTTPNRILHFRLDADALCHTAKKKSVTVTAYILSRMFAAAKYATEDTSGDFSIEVPVNMRKFYPSKTLRNFSMYCGVRIPVSDIHDADLLLPEISAQLQAKASRQSMSEMMNATKRILKLIQFIPLAVKAPAAKVIYGFLGDNIFSSTLSNLGVVRLPSALAEQIQSMDFALGTSNLHRASCTLVTFGNTATLSVTKMTADPAFEEKLYELFCADGLVPVVEGSEQYEG